MANIDLDVILTRNILMWSQTRYLCDKKSFKESSHTVMPLCFFSFQQLFYVFWKCYFFLEMRYFHRKNKSPKSFQAFSWNFLKNYKLQSRWKLTSMWFEHATFWSGVRRAIVAPRSPRENRAVRLKNWVFFLPVFIFLWFKCVYLLWIDSVLLETKKAWSS